MSAGPWTSQPRFKKATIPQKQQQVESSHCWSWQIFLFLLQTGTLVSSVPAVLSQTPRHAARWVPSSFGAADVGRRCQVTLKKPWEEAVLWHNFIRSDIRDRAVIHSQLTVHTVCVMGSNKHLFVFPCRNLRVCEVCTPCDQGFPLR